MGDVQAQGLDHGFALLKIHTKIFVNIPGKQRLQVDQLLDVLSGLRDLIGAVALL